MAVLGPDIAAKARAAGAAIVTHAAHAEGRDVLAGSKLRFVESGH